VSVTARDAFLPVDKPPGPTSHDVVAVARRALGERRVGHTGTLDPFASGLLLLCVGRATRLAEFVTGMEKRYEAVARLGVATDTLDPEGEVVAESEGWRDLGLQEVEKALAGLRGRIRQVPPAYSAKKVAGVAAHRLTRRGVALRLPPQEVTVHALEVSFFRPPEVGLGIHCSSGTYVRALARDLGDALGVGAHLTALRRTSVGPFQVADALALDDLSVPERVSERWIGPLSALAHLPRMQVDGVAEEELGHGRTVPYPGHPDASPVVAVRGDELVAVGDLSEGRFRPRKVFAHD
jgi:tRNA pseudouridine55 synthase